MARIAAVVVTYNRLNILGDCLEHLLRQSTPCDILLVDNASTDSTGAWAEDFCLTHPTVHYQNTGANLGGAGGFHFGMKWAVEAGYDYVWIMDDDCLPKPDALERLMEADAILGGGANYGFLSSAVLWHDGTECKMNRQKLKKSYYEHLELLKHGIVQVEQATFVSLLFPAHTIRKAGLPIKEFFIWGDDIEYTRRLTVRLGLPCYLAGQSQVIHAMKENNGSSIALDAPERIDRYRYAFRNECYLYRKEGLKGVCYYLAKCGLNLLRVVTKAKDYKFRRCGVIVSSMCRGVAFRPEVEYIQTQASNEQGTL